MRKTIGVGSDARYAYDGLDRVIHERGLIESRLVVISKVSEQNRRQTCIRMTALGRKRFIEYLAVLEQVLEDATARARGAAVVGGPRARSAG
jgi:hypothetical protein